jgi:hypothetical protein
VVLVLELELVELDPVLMAPIGAGPLLAGTGTFSRVA